VKKMYLALVDGFPPTPTGRIEAAIGRDPAHRKRLAVVPDEKGREAITEYTMIETFKKHALLEAFPFTGRTHQIRIHLAFLGCPIVADTLYGKKHTTLPLARHFLHAAKLTVVIPGESDPRIFSAPLPADLVEILDILRKGA
jgi:23S rRNA pseudouridine1911/1915/1917 synthase